MTNITEVSETNEVEKNLINTDVKITQSCSTGSILFRRNRALGYVSNGIPAIVRYVQRRKDSIITTCIGRSFQVYTANHFRLLHVSPLHPDDITAMVSDRFHTFTASNKCIYAWRAGKHITRIYRGHTSKVNMLLPFGKNHLVAIDESNVLKVWHIKSGDVYLDIPFNAEEFRITAIIQPPTYINKVLLGSEQGQLKIWNLKDNRLVYTFQGYDSGVSCLQFSPALDVVAVGHQDGTITLLNLKYDEVLMSFKQDWGAVIQITFRTDGPPIMATTSFNGYIAFWNLEENKVAGQEQAHTDQVTTAIYFANEPLLLTTSPDNSMKLWIHDKPDGGARMLRIREGHLAPPLCIRYHGANGKSILSSGEDSTLRIFSTVSESFNRSLGRASYNRKSSKKKNRFAEDPLIMPPILEFTTEITREKEWDNIVAIHAGIIQSTTWSFHKNRMGEHRLIPEKFFNKQRTDFKTEPTCLMLTYCGNFVIIGYSNGTVERFNVQSGIHRASYGPPAHENPVRGVSTDNLNQCVISGCSVGVLKFWPFKENISKPLALLKFNEGIALMRTHRESAMLAVALVNFVVYIVDTDTRAIVREFKGHAAKINDVTFSPDSRWLITAAMDSTIKVWDIPSSYMIDHFRAERPCVSLTMSPTGDFLATAHVNNLGIYLWANKMIFNQITLRSINPYEKAPFVGLPTSACDESTLEEAFAEVTMDEDENDDVSDEVNVIGEEINAKYETPSQLSHEIISMSGVAASRWQNLLDLELIKKRNKPRTQLKKPKQAPFFLPTVAGTELKFDLSNIEQTNKQEVASSMLNASTVNNLTSFGKLLESCKESEDYSNCVNHMKQLGPSMVDFEIKSLHPLGGGTNQVMLQFLKMIEFMFNTNSNFELAQSYLSVYLRSHSLSLLDMPEIVKQLPKVNSAQERCWKTLEEKLMFGMGVVAALRNFVQ